MISCRGKLAVIPSIRRCSVWTWRTFNLNAPDGYELWNRLFSFWLINPSRRYLLTYDLKKLNPIISCIKLDVEMQSGRRHAISLSLAYRSGFISSSFIFLSRCHSECSSLSDPVSVWCSSTRWRHRTDYILIISGIWWSAFLTKGHKK